MCTVTFIPTEKGRFFLTSNRDEKIHRPTTPPVFEVINGSTVLFPRDLKAGGTWIATSERGRTCCILNGGFEQHSWQQHHTKSRGLIVLETFQYATIDEFFNKVVLENTEPFTMIIAEVNPDLTTSLFQFVWDGSMRHVERKDEGLPAIWSSSTLYTPYIRKKREELFHRWMTEQTSHSKESVLHFHTSWNQDDEENSVLLLNDNDLRTVSITQVHQGTLFAEMRYIDLQRKSSSSNLLVNNHAICLQ